MKNLTFKLLSGLLICAMSSFGFAASKDSDLDKLMTLSGITDQVSQIPGQFKAGLMQGMQQGASLPEEEANTLLNSVDQSVDPSVVSDAIRSSIAASLSAKEIKSLLKWYESDIGKTITAAESNASTPEAYQDMMMNARQLLSDSKRVEYANRLDSLIGATDMSMEFQEYTGLAVYTAMMTAMMPNRPVDTEGYKAQMAAVEPQMRQQMQQVVTVNYVYAYKDLDDATLAKYEDFQKEDVTRKFNASGIKGLNLGFEKIIDVWVNELADLMKSKSNRQQKAGV